MSAAVLKAQEAWRLCRRMELALLEAMKATGVSFDAGPRAAVSPS